jgi:hypothetical protein
MLRFVFVIHFLKIIMVRPRAEETRDVCPTAQVPTDADENPIKQPYRERALAWHPDQTPGKGEDVKARFQEVNGAYEVIRDARRGREWEEAGPRGWAGYRAPKRSDEELVLRFFRETVVVDVKSQGSVVVDVKSQGYVRSLVKAVEHTKDALRR